MMLAGQHCEVKRCIAVEFLGQGRLAGRGLVLVEIAPLPALARQTYCCDDFLLEIHEMLVAGWAFRDQNREMETRQMKQGHHSRQAAEGDHRVARMSQMSPDL